MNGFLKKQWYIYTMEYCAAVKKRNTFVTARMDLETTMLSEISGQWETNTIWSYFYVESNEQNKLISKIESKA